jgi:protein-tyrosine phosphatase
MGRLLSALLLPAILLASACGTSEPELQGDALRRHVVLEGAANFRDLGGYATRDGRTLRWGVLYRSDDLGELTPADVEVVRQLGLQLVCDFRSAGERAEQPDRLPAQNPPDVLHLPIHDDAIDPADLGARIRAGQIDGLDFDQLLIDANRSFALRFAGQYARMLERLSDPDNLPALVHCTAGKDRAGFAAAVILLTLGVPMETVFEDYLLTNAYTAEATERTLFWIRVLSLFRTDPARLRPLFEARPEYLQAAFDAIEANHASFDAYLELELDISAEERQRLQDLLLE